MLNRFNSNIRKLNRIVKQVNTNNLVSTDLTGSLLNIEIPTDNKFNSNTKSNPNPTKLVNNKSKINNFYSEILENSARYISKQVDAFSNIENALTIYSASLDYGTEGANSDNFEVLVYGLHIPGDYQIKELNGNVKIILGSNYIDYDSVTIDDIYVIGKFK